MELVSLKVNARDDSGKGAARKTRREGRVPAVLYGGKEESVSLTVDDRTLDHLLHGKYGEHAIVQLEVEGRPELNGPALVKSVQHDPIRGTVLHADFFRISLDEKIHTVTSIHVIGRSKGVIEGGILDHQLRELEIECLALQIPDYIEIDVSPLEIGDSIHVSEVSAPDGVEIITPEDRTIVAVHAPRVVAAATTAEGEELEEGVEGEEAPEGGEAPAAEEGSSD